MDRRLRTNHQIRVPQVEVIDDTGKKLGILATFEARRIAEEKGLDLVEINPNVGLGKAPLAKIMDYGKYLYEKEKRAKQGGKKGKEQELKEIRFGYRIDSHDMQIRAKKVEEFFKEGHKVLIGISLRGRELGLAHLAKEKLEKFLSFITTPYQSDGFIKRQPKGWSVVLMPLKNK